MIIIGNKNFRRPKAPAPSAAELQRITNVRRAIEIEQRLCRMDGGRLVAEYREKYGKDLSPQRSWDILAERRESAITAAYRAGEVCSGRGNGKVEA